MNSKLKYYLKIDLSKLPSDIIPCISAHLTDYSVLDKSLRNKRTNNYLLYFFFHKNMPKDMQNGQVQFRRPGIGLHAIS